MSKQMVNWREWVWRLGVPIGTFLLAWGPYWIWNLSSSVLRPEWWRVRVLTHGIFDTYVYAHWMAAAALGLPYGGHLKWLGSVVQVIWRTGAEWITLPELWIVTRWLATMLTLVVGARLIERWMGLTRNVSRLLSLGLWLAVVMTLGLRPGVYSWYLPFCLLGLLCGYLAGESFAKQRFLRGLGYGVVGLWLSSVYPWFLLLVGVWFAAMAGISLIQKRRTYFFIIVALGVLGILVAAPWLARWVLAPEQAGLLGMYERNGVVFARVPFFANTLLAMGGWMALLLACAREVFFEQKTRFASVVGLWFSVILLWFHTPIAGIFLYSDHFIGPVTILSWLSLAVIVAAAEAPSQAEKTSKKGDRFSWLVRRLPLVVAVGATAVFVYVLQQPIRLHPLKADPYIIHLAHWFALTMAAWLVYWRRRYPLRPLSNRNVLALILGVSVVLGVWGMSAVVLRDMKQVSKVESHLPAIHRIMDQVPVTVPMCADPATASFYAAHTGRVIHPAEATFSYPFSSEQVLRHLEILGAAYDVESSGNIPFFQFAANQYRNVACEVGPYAHNATLGRILRSFGMEGERLNVFLGCREQVIERNWQRVFTAIHERRGSDDGFRRLCPWVIIPKEQHPFWQLPAGYEMIWQENGIQLWKI